MIERLRRRRRFPERRDRVDERKGAGREAPARSRQRSWWNEIRRRAFLILLALAGSAAIAAAYMWKAPPRNPPLVILQASSFAVVFVPSGNFDLAQAARPRFSVEPGGTQYAGLRFLDTVRVREIGATREDIHPEAIVRILQSLDVANCTVTLEHWVDDKVLLKIEDLPPAVAAGEANRTRQANTTCRIFAEILVNGPVPYGTIERPIEASSPLLLTFTPAAPLRLRRIPVAELRFETEEAGQNREVIVGETRMQSAIISATASLPDYADDVERAVLGDPVKLGELQGEIVELIVGDTLHTLYKGTTTDLQIAERSLMPTLLEEHANNRNLRLAIGFAIGLLGIAAAVFQAILR